MSGALGQLFDHFRGRDGLAWAGSVEDLLFEGEEVRRTIEFEDNRIVVTSHRLLAFTPESDGENFQRVDLPNVADVRSGQVGESNLLRQGVRFLLYGGVLLAVGALVDFDSFVPTDGFGGGEGASRLGMGGLLTTMNRFVSLLAQADRYALLFGAGLLLFSSFVLGVYLLTRERVLLVAVAGDENDICVPASSEAVDRTVGELETELFSTDSSGERGPGRSEGVGREGTDGTSGDAGFKSDDPL